MARVFENEGHHLVENEWHQNSEFLLYLSRMKLKIVLLAADAIKGDCCSEIPKYQSIEVIGMSEWSENSNDRVCPLRLLSCSVLQIVCHTAHRYPRGSAH